MNNYSLLFAQNKTDPAQDKIEIAKCSLTIPSVYLLAVSIDTEFVTYSNSSVAHAISGDYYKGLDLVVDFVNQAMGVIDSHQPVFRKLSLMKRSFLNSTKNPTCFVVDYSRIINLFTIPKDQVQGRIIDEIEYTRSHTSDIIQSLFALSEQEYQLKQQLNSIPSHRDSDSKAEYENKTNSVLQINKQLSPVNHSIVDIIGENWMGWEQVSSL